MKQAENKSEKYEVASGRGIENLYEKKKLFFRAAFKTDEQNCLRQHDFELILEFYTRQIESRTGQKLNEKLKFLLEMYCQGSVYMTTQWVLGYRKSTPEKMHAVRVTRKIQM